MKEYLCGGIEKFSLVDYEGKLATTIFLNGCNFRCPWCHNSSLISFSFHFSSVIDSGSG